MTIPMTLLHVMHGVMNLEDVDRQIGTFRDNAGSLLLADTKLFIGDAIEKGQTGPDRRSDHSGSPLVVALTPVDSGVASARANHDLLSAIDASAIECSRHETWLLRHQFECMAVNTVPCEREDWLQIVIMNVDPSVDGEFNEWYETEHVARIAAVAPEFVSVRRMEALCGSPRYAALWRMKDRKAPERDPWLSASETPWTMRIRRFMRDRRRLLLAPYVAHR